MKVKKRALLLLEVLIACVILIFCASTLLSPQVSMALQQRQIVRKGALNNWMNRYYAKFLEDLYKNSIPFDQLVNKVPFSIENDELQQLSFEGSCKCESIHHKPLKKESSEHYYVIQATFSFDDLLDKNRSTPIQFEYHFFVTQER
jgi:hypothetical protein